MQYMPNGTVSIYYSLKIDQNYDDYLRLNLSGHEKSQRLPSIGIDVSRLAVGFQKHCIEQPPALQLHHSRFCIAYSTPNGGTLFKEHFHNPC